MRRHDNNKGHVTGAWATHLTLSLHDKQATMVNRHKVTTYLRVLTWPPQLHAELDQYPGCEMSNAISKQINTVSFNNVNDEFQHKTQHCLGVTFWLTDETKKNFKVNRSRTRHAYCYNLMQMLLRDI